MIFENEYLVMCEQIGEEVVLSSSVDASAGMGCMVNYDFIDYECKRQKVCPFYRKDKCLLINGYDLSDLKS